MKLFRRARRLFGGKDRSAGAHFSSSQAYWEERYRKGGNSGAGSYGRLADYKADFINDFVARHGILSSIEFGCGDGNQASMLEIPEYVGVDVSTSALELSRARASNRPGWRFCHVSDSESYAGRFDLAMSLDVIFHLVEDDVFERYMNSLLDHGGRHVLIYSSDLDGQHPAAHVRHRCFSDWIARNRPEWRLVQKFENPFRSESNTEDVSDPDGKARSFAIFAHFTRTNAEAVAS